MSGAPSRKPLRKTFCLAASRCAWVLAGALVVLLWVPWNPWIGGPAGSPDHNWQQVLMWAWEKKLVFGRDVVFTFGPWGFALSEGYWPGVYPVVMALRLLLAGAIIWGFVTLRRRAAEVVPVAGEKGEASFWGPAGLAMIALAGGRWADWTWMFDPALMCLCPLLGALMVFRKGGQVDWVVILVTFVLGWAALTKFTMLPFAVGTVLVCGLAEVVSRRWPTVFVTFGLAVGFWWLAACQPLAAFPVWVMRAGEEAAAYGQTMQAWGRVTPWRVMWVMAVALPIWAVASVWWLRAARAGAVALAVVTGATVLLAAKAGFTRSDELHVSVAVRVIILLLVVLTPVFAVGVRQRLATRVPVASSRSWKPLVWGSALAAIVGVSVLSLTSREDWSRVGYEVKLIPGTFAERLRHAATLGPSLEEVERRMAETRRDMNVRMPLPGEVLSADSGGVDMVGTNYQYRLVWGAADFRPRPTIQSYAAMSPGGQRRNAERFRTPDAARFVIFGMEPIDMHWPVQEDARVILELLAGYEVHSEIAGTDSPRRLLLQRTPRPGSYRMELLAQLKGRFGEKVPVPPAGEGELVWVSMAIRPSAGGRVKLALWSPPPLWMHYGLDGESQGVSRGGIAQLMLPAALDGFLISPAIENVDAFKAAVGRELQVLPRVTTLSIDVAEGDPASEWYEEAIEFSFFRVVLEP